MSVIKSILVPVDFSSVAANAFDFALRLADRYPARIDLLYCNPTALSSPGMDRIIVARGGEMKAEALNNMNDFREQGIDAAIYGLTVIPEVHTFIVDGDLDPVVKQRIAAGKVDLVVMGTTGREKPLANLVGTNTTYLIDEATVPVLIVPNEASYRRPQNLCYGTDLEHLDALLIRYLFELFAPFDPVADVVYVASSDRKDTKFDLNLLREAVDCPKIQDRLSFTQLTGKDEVKELLHYAKASNADLLVMNRPRRGWLERLWRHSHTREAMLKAEVPLLILNTAKHGE